MKGVTIGSDAFFHLATTLSARKSGVQYIAQPGGSVRDDNVIEVCNKYGIVMAFTESVCSIINEKGVKNSRFSHALFISKQSGYDFLYFAS